VGRDIDEEAPNKSKQVIKLSKMNNTTNSNDAPDPLRVFEIG
jgi:hypothetical protein